METLDEKKEKLAKLDAQYRAKSQGLADLEQRIRSDEAYHESVGTKIAEYKVQEGIHKRKFKEAEQRVKNVLGKVKNVESEANKIMAEAKQELSRAEAIAKKNEEDSSYLEKAKVDILKRKGDAQSVMEREVEIRKELKETEKLKFAQLKLNKEIDKKAAELDIALAKAEGDKEKAQLIVNEAVMKGDRADQLLAGVDKQQIEVKYILKEAEKARDEAEAELILAEQKTQDLVRDKELLANTINNNSKKREVIELQERDLNLKEAKINKIIDKLKKNKKLEDDLKYVDL